MKLLYVGEDQGHLIRGKVHVAIHIDNAIAFEDKAASTHNDSNVSIPQQIHLSIIL